MTELIGQIIGGEVYVSDVDPNPPHYPEVEWEVWVGFSSGESETVDFFSDKSDAYLSARLLVEQHERSLR